MQVGLYQTNLRSTNVLMCFAVGRQVFRKTSVGAYINLYTASFLKIDFVPQRLFLKFN